MKSLNWGGQSALDPKFLEIVNRWIEQDGEVYVMYWFIKAGGVKAHYLFNSYSQFLSNLTSSLWMGLHFGVDVYRHPQFPVRGWVDDDFVKRVLGEIPEHQDWFLISFDDEIGKGETLNTWGDNTQKALVEELKHCYGKYVIVGPDVHWPISPNDYPGEWIEAEIDNRKKEDI